MAPSSAIVLLTTSIWSSKFGFEISTKWIIKSDSLTSSSVDLKLSTNWCGNFRINPTVSVNRNGRLPITTLRTVVSRVANNLFSAKTSDLANLFISVDFPALVYPINATLIRCSRPFLLVCDCLSIFFNFFFNKVILSLIIWRSVSICVSPGPLMPIPPFWRSKWVHKPVNLGNKYWYCASSTCVRAWDVFARLAKISRIKLLLSKILTFPSSALSIFFIWEGVKSSSKITESILWSSTKILISSIFPLPMNVLLLAEDNLCVINFTGLAPAVFARNDNSSRYSYAWSLAISGVIKPIKTAFSILKIN